MGTLTYRGAGCHDPVVFREHIGPFFRTLRRELGGKPLPYLWVPEWHPSGHGLHAHFAVGQYVPRRLIEEAWCHGFVHIKLLADLPVGSGDLAEARKAAGYLAKYVGKAFGEAPIEGLHRYDVAQGFAPITYPLIGASDTEVLDAACEIMSDAPAYVWHSGQASDWHGPPAVWASWPG